MTHKVNFLARHRWSRSEELDHGTEMKLAIHTDLDPQDPGVGVPSCQRHKVIGVR